MDLIKKLIISIGLSILIGLAFGYIKSENKYYYLGETKREITKKQYNGWSKKSRIQEKTFNYEWALTAGLGVFGLSLITIGLLKNKKE